MAEINVTGASSLYMKVDITNVRQNVSGNSSTVKFVASMRQTSGNNWNQVPGVDFKVVVNGSTKANQTGFFLDVRNNVTQVFYTGDIVIPHNTDGTKSFSWSFWFDPKGTWHTYKPTTLSGTQALPRIARVSNATLSANTFDFGESFTVYTNQSDPSFTHTISYIRGTTVTSLATGVKTSKAVTIPTAQISNYTTATTASMKIRTSTYSGGTLVGDYDLDVTVRVPSTAVPTIGAVSFTGSNAVFSANTQFIASKDRLKATVANVTTSYSSPIKTYLYRVSQRHTFSMEGTSNGATFPTFNFPATGSEVVNIQMAVVDARGRQSAWSTSPAIRVHAYQPPSIGATVITRNANVTTVNVRRNWSVTPLYESGSTSAPKNTGTLVVNYRAAGNTTWSSTNGGASGLSGNNSSVALTGFAGGTSYEFQIKLTDKFQTTTAPIIKLGTEFVPLDIGPKGAGVGKIHDDGGYNLQVGSGGLKTDGHLLASSGAQVTGSLVASSALQGNHINITGNGGNVQALNTFYSTSNGLLIDICGHHTYNMITVYVKGNGYSGLPINSMFQTYHYDSVGAFLQTKQINFGYTMPTGVFFVHGTRIKLWIPQGAAYQTFTVTATGMNGAVYNVGLSDSAFPGSITYRSNCVVTKSWHSGNHGPGSQLNADMLDGKHATAFADFKYTKSGNYEVFELGQMMIIIGAKGTDTTVSEWTRDGSVSYPKAFGEFPRVSLTVTTFSTRDKATPYLYSNTKTGFDFSVWDNPVNGVRTVHFIAIGRIY